VARLPTLPSPCTVSRPKPSLSSTSPARMRAGRAAGSGRRYVSARAAGLLSAPWGGSARSRSEAASRTDRANVGSVCIAGANLGCGMTRTRMSVAATTEAVRSPPRSSPSSPKKSLAPARSGGPRPRRAHTPTQPRAAGRADRPAESSPGENQTASDTRALQRRQRQVGGLPPYRRRRSSRTVSEVLATQGDATT
jgi:hypothetical protein